MSKRSIAYIKPDEPSFLRKIKEQVGYKEGPTVDTKKQDAGPVLNEDLEDTQEELPVVVVLRPGDLTAEEAESHKKQIEKEEAELPADLDAPIVFKPKPKKKADGDQDVPTAKRQKTKKDKIKKTVLLSFDEEENDDF